MGRFRDLTDMKFNRLTVKEIAGRDPYGKILYRCECECGGQIVTLGRSLLNGRCGSCGCLKSVAKRKYSKYNGLTADEYRLHYIWKGMVSRCNNIKNKHFADYGGRGICICDEWADEKNGFPAFVEWAKANGYAANLTIDRINNDGDYTPQNCRWADWTTQANNRRRPKKVKNQYGVWDYKMPLPQPPEGDE